MKLLSWLAGTAVSVPVVAGYVALGTVVLVGRSLLAVAGGAWRRLASLGVEPSETPRAA